MATVPREEPQIWVKGMTAPSLETQFGQEDGVSFVNLNGYAAQNVFWYVSSAGPHKVGASGVTNPIQGVTKYEPDGNETPTVGRLIYQVEVLNPGSPDSTVEEWGSFSTGPFRVLVVNSI